MSQYKKQVDLLINVLPYLNEIENFALKGGTAINLFYQSFPRLSVDIDLAYLPLTSRPDFIDDFNYQLNLLEKKLKKKNYSIDIIYTSDKKIIRRMDVSFDNAMIKIEPNTVIRGAVLESALVELNLRVQDIYRIQYEVPVLAFDEIYAGKFCAALDRQHPRDLYDVKKFFENTSISEKLMEVFIIYLLSSPRPPEELLNPNLQTIEQAYKNEFEGMTTDELCIDDLYLARNKLIQKVKKMLTEKQLKFILSFISGDPNWELCRFHKASELPAIKWKLKNILKLKSDNPEKYRVSLDKFNDIYNSILEK